MARLIRVLTALAFAAACASALAQEYPAKPVRIVVPYSAGGGIDALIRAIGQRLYEAWGQPALVENKPGASGIIGAEYVAKSAADGYTLLVTEASLLLNSILHGKLPYDSVKDFAPVTQLVIVHHVLAVNSTLPAKNIRELIELAKTKPGELSYASYGTGSVAHLEMELFQAMAGIRLVHIPYKGGGPAFTDVVAGRVPMTFASFGIALPQWKAGKVRLLGVVSPRRYPRYPEVPTVAEAGLPGYEVTPWFGLHAPAATPREVINRISAEAQKILADPVFREKNLDPQGLEPTVSSPERFSEMLKSQALQWGKIVRDANVRLD